MTDKPEAMKLIRTELQDSPHAEACQKARAPIEFGFWCGVAAEREMWDPDVQETFAQWLMEAGMDTARKSIWGDPIAKAIDEILGNHSVGDPQRLRDALVEYVKELKE